MVVTKARRRKDARMTGPPSYPDTGNTSQAAAPPPPVATGIGSCLAAYLVFQAFLPAGDAMRTTLAEPGVLRAVTGAGLYLTVRPEPHMLQPWTGFGVFCLYAAAALAAGFVLIGRRDA
jgi:hypothetical protein